MLMLMIMLSGQVVCGGIFQEQIANQGYYDDDDADLAHEESLGKGQLGE